MRAMELHLIQYAVIRGVGTIPAALSLWLAACIAAITGE